MKEIILLIDEGRHLPPKCFEYKVGTFAKVNKCIDCGLLGLDKNLHYLTPCPVCGAEVRGYKAGQWDKKLRKWLVRK